MPQLKSNSGKKEKKPKGFLIGAVKSKALPRGKKAARIAIAKDVLAQLRAKKLKAKAGKYLAIRLAVNSADVRGKDLQELMATTPVKSCEACALGSAFLSYARIFDKVKVDNNTAQVASDWGGPVDVETGYYTDSEIMADRPDRELQRFFDPDQLDEIESAFERSPLGFLEDSTVKSPAVKFGNRYPNADARLKAIMTNIVKNDGEFKP